MTSSNFGFCLTVHKKPCAPAGRRQLPPPPETEKIVVEKWCYFPELYKMTEVREDRIESG